VREGDVILEVDGQPVPNKVSYLQAISKLSAVSRLYVRRGGKALFFGLRRDPPAVARARGGSAGDAAR
jgi:hypothetical protein